MARIAREEHAAIRRRVDVDGERVADVASAYGCTPANIYAILAKQRRQDGENTPAQEAAPPVVQPAAPPTPVATGSADLFAVSTDQAKVEATPPRPVTPDTAPPKEAKTAATGTPGRAAAPAPIPTSPSAPPPSRPSRTGAAPRAPAPKAARTGYALIVRNGDGEEAVNPFRSLDELLSAAKPILRNAARSPEPVWFSIQQVDLDALDDLS